MGFSAWDCPGCNTPILGHMAINHKTRWMNDCVVIFQSGDRISGSYDGYGRVNGIHFFNDYDAKVGKNDPYPTSTEDNPDDLAQFWHRKCWDLAGQPPYSGPSHSSLDQGWFFNEGGYDEVVPGQPFIREEDEDEDEEVEESVPSP